MPKHEKIRGMENEKVDKRGWGEGWWRKEINESGLTTSMVTE